MLVGSIGHTRAEGVHVERAEELGYFAYGGTENLSPSCTLRVNVLICCLSRLNRYRTLP